MTFCDYAMSSQDNKFSIIGIFDEVRVSQFPGGLAAAAIVAIVKGKPDTSYVISAEGKKGKKSMFPPIELTITTGRSGVSNITINLNNIGFPEAGDYDFILSQGKKEIGQTTLKVIDVSKKNEEPITYKLPN